MRRLIEGLSKGKATAMTVIDELYATDIPYHRGTGEEIRGLQDFKQVNGEFYDALPDMDYKIEQMISEGDLIATLWTMSATHEHELRPRSLERSIPPTHRKVTISAITIDRFVDGKIVEEWERFDTLGLMRQLGLLPSPKQDTMPP